MKNLKASLFLFGFMVLFTLSAVAQTSVFEGKITAFDGIAVENAVVMIKKSKASVVTDSEGNFEIECKTKDKITIIASGFKKKSLKASDLSSGKDIQLIISKGEKGVEMATSNGHISERDKMRAIKFVNTKRPYGFGYNTMTELVKAKFPNLTVTDDEIIMRGPKSLDTNISSSGALIVLNGATYTWNSLKTQNVMEVDDIKLLTGVQAQRYGPGSGNGVLVIKLISN